MVKWFVVHDLLAFKQHPNLISNIAVKTIRGIKPKFKNFRKIKAGDLVVYYATKDLVVTGIFQIISKMQYLSQDQYWGDVMIYEIKPFKMPPKGKYVDFKKLLNSENVNFDMFPNKDNWGSYLQGKTCLLLSETDYLKIEKALFQEELLLSKNKIKVLPTRWHEKYGKTIKYNSINKGIIK